jgi:hypothetical protein
VIPVVTAVSISKSKSIILLKVPQQKPAIMKIFFLKIVTKADVTVQLSTKNKEISTHERKKCA